MQKLSGKVAIVTGAARGLGRGYALRLANLGANVAICDKNLRSFEDYAYEREQVAASDVVDELKALGVDAFASQFDSADQNAINVFVNDVHSRWGRVDVLVSNAGGGLGSPEGGKASDLDVGQLHKLIEMNLYSAIYAALAVAPYMKHQRSGKIINIASLAAITANVDGTYSDYGTAKAGVAAYTRYLAQDLAPYGISVNALAPGLIATGQWRARFGKNDQARLDGMADKVPMRRLGSVDDCARVVEFLATDLSDYVTGQIIPVDGGLARFAS
jgi:3-oxoacyl-[acyl-carrier protein] reductase